MNGENSPWEVHEKLLEHSKQIHLQVIDILLATIFDHSVGWKKVIEPVALSIGKDIVT